MGNIDKHKIRLVNISYGHCRANPEFFEDFYKTFMSSAPQIKPMFRNTDMQKQKKLLRFGIMYMLMYVQGNELGISALKKIGIIHSRHRVNVKPELYSLWVASLLESVSRYDKEFNAEIAAAWRECLDPGIKFLVSMY